MKKLSMLLFLLAASALTFPGTPQSEPNDLLVPCSVSLRQEVVVETIKNPVIQNETLVGGDVADREMDIVDMGSGTLISRSGLILTNYHVWQFEPRLRQDKQKNVVYRTKAATEDMLVYMLDPANPFKEPKKKYVARCLSADSEQDIVVLKCILDATSGQELSQLNLPYMKVGNPFGIPMNARINILGYPGIGGKTVTMTTGKFLGYYADSDCTIKTDAAISFGNSGGSAIYQNALFGVPTAVSAGQAGANFGYIVPITRAFGPLMEAKMRFGEEIPGFDKKWFVSSMNSDISRESTYIGGRIVSATTGSGVKDARIWIYRSDRTADQIDALSREVRRIRLIASVQKAIRAGQKVEEVAKSKKLTEDDVRSAVKIDIEAIASADAKSYFRGEFFYTIEDASADGFFFTLTEPVPRNAQIVLVVVREGYRRIERRLQIPDDLVLDFGAIKAYPY